MSTRGVRAALVVKRQSAFARRAHQGHQIRVRCSTYAPTYLRPCGTEKGAGQISSRHKIAACFHSDCTADWWSVVSACLGSLRDPLRRRPTPSGARPIPPLHFRTPTPTADPPGPAMEAGSTQQRRARHKGSTQTPNPSGYSLFANRRGGSMKTVPP